MSDFSLNTEDSADVNDNKFFKFDFVEWKENLLPDDGSSGGDKNPKGADCTDEQREYISIYANEVNWAILRKQWNKILRLVELIRSLIILLLRKFC